LKMFGPLGRWLVALGAVISCVGVLNGWVLLQGQVPMAAAEDKLFPAAFAKKSINGTPYVGLVVSSVLVTILLSLTLNNGLNKQFTHIILLATLATLIPYLLSTMAQLLLFLRDRKRFSKKILIRSSIIASLAFVYSFWAIFGAGKDTVFYGILLFFSGVPVYVWMRWRTIVQEDLLEKSPSIT